MSSYCTDFSESENWVSGERIYEVDVETNTSSFEASFSSGDWIALNAGINRNWEVRIKGDLVIRHDIGRVNTPPVTAMRPLVRLHYSRSSELRIPVADIDGDTVRCRWANSTLGECAEVCNGFPFGILDEDGCILTYNGSGDVGFYAVAIQVEDFATPNGTRPMSSVPIQFVVNIISENGSDTCLPPRFVYPTPADGAQVNIEKYTQFTSRVTVEPRCPTRSIDIQTVSPLGLKRSNLSQIPSSRLWYTDFKWAPSSLQSGPHFFCFQAYDGISLSSAQHCVSLMVNSEGVPLCATDVVAAVHVTNSTTIAVTVAWQVSSLTTVTSYLVSYCSMVSFQCTNTSCCASPCTIIGLDPATKYNFTVFPQNAYGSASGCVANMATVETSSLPPDVCGSSSTVNLILTGTLPSIILLLTNVISIVTAVVITRYCYRKSSSSRNQVTSEPASDKEYEVVHNPNTYDNIVMTNSPAYAYP
jgi:hypothetical protein